MKDLELKYGCNPNQKPSRIFVSDGRDLPIIVRNGRPGYINFMDALNGWQLVRDLKKATGLPSATSFKHVSPAGAAVAAPLSDVMKKIYFVDDMGDLSPLASAYARARGADRMSSFGDFISLSDTCDADTARIIKREVSDGVIAPGYTDEALAILKEKKNGNYTVIEIDPDYVPEPLEHKDVFGITFEQGRNELEINNDILANVVTKNKDIPDEAKRDLVISLTSATPRTGRPSASARASRAACTACVSREIRPTTGCSASARRYWSCRSWTASAARTATMPSTSTSEMSTWTCCGTAPGRSSSRSARTSSPKRKSGPGSTGRTAYPSVPTRSSRSLTISSARRRAV